MFARLATVSLLTISFASSPSTAGEPSDHEIMENRYYHCASQGLTEFIPPLTKVEGESKSEGKPVSILDWAPKKTEKVLIPGTPRPVGPPTDTVISVNGQAMVATDRIDDVTFVFEPAPVRSQLLAYSQAANPREAIGDTTHYEICVAHGDDFFCDLSQVTRNRHFANDVIYQFPCTGDFSYTPAHGQLRLSPSTPNKVLHLNWKIRACNGPHCSDWSDRQRLLWLPAVTLDNPVNGRVWDRWQQGSQSLEARESPRRRELPARQRQPPRDGERHRRLCVLRLVLPRGLWHRH